MSVMFNWICGEAMCKHQFSAELPDTPNPWPLRCPKCNRSLYPDDLLQRPEPGEIMVPERAELRVWSGGRSIECTAKELRRMRGLPEKSPGGKLLAPRSPAVAIEPSPSASRTVTRRFSRGRIALAGSITLVIALLIIVLLGRS